MICLHIELLCILLEVCSILYLLSPTESLTPCTVLYFLGTKTSFPLPPVYLELAYIPGSTSAQRVDEDFFRRVRSQCYVISGEDHIKEGVMRGILDALLAGKQHWVHDTQVGLYAKGEREMRGSAMCMHQSVLCPERQ